MSKYLLAGIVFYLLLGLLLVVAVRAQAATYYAAPNGTGLACVRSTPCSFSSGQQKVSPGDELILLDGTYTQTFTTAKSGVAGKPIVIQAENKHKAVFRKSSGSLTQIKNNYLIIRGIRFDGQRTGGSNGGLRIGYDGMPGIHDVTVEHSIIENVGYSCVHITMGQYNIIVRHNIVRSCGNVAYWGEAFYLGNKTQSSMTVKNIQIYGNEISDFTENGIDMKPYAKDLDIHHNIFWGQLTAKEQGATSGVTADRGSRNQGTIELSGTSTKVYDNILRDNKSGWGPFVVRPNADHQVYGNVVYNERNATGYATQYLIRALTWGVGSPGLRASEIRNNTLCTLTTAAVSGNSGLRIRDNNSVIGRGAPPAECEREVQRILHEIEQLPGRDSLPPPPPVPTGLTLTHARFHAVYQPEGSAWITPEDSSAAVYPTGQVRIRVQVAAADAAMLQKGYAWYCRDNEGEYYKVNALSVDHFIGLLVDPSITPAPAKPRTKQLLSCPQNMACTEFETAFAVGNTAVPGQTITCRIEQTDGTDLDTYNKLATMTIVAPSQDE